MKKKTEAKAGIGRPCLYRKSFDKLAENYSLLGARDEDLANYFNVDQATIDRWKLKYPSFCVSIRKGKGISDCNVVQSLYRRAVGGDVTAIKYWLNNRQRSKWADRQSIDYNPRQVEFAELLKSINGTANQLPSSRLKNEANS